MVKNNKFWTTVTPLSKTLAMALFILLPFLGFCLGKTYQRILDVTLNLPKPESVLSETTNLDTKLWKKYSFAHFSVNYPAEWTVKSSSSADLFTYFSGPNDQLVFIRVYSDEGLTLDQWANKESVNGTKMIETINGQRVYKFEGLPSGPQGGLDYALELDNEIVSIGAGPYFPGSGQSADSLKHIHDIVVSMISTLNSN